MLMPFREHMYIHGTAAKRDDDDCQHNYGLWLRSKRVAIANSMKANLSHVKMSETGLRV